MSIFRINSLGDGLGDCFIIEISNGLSSTTIMVDGHRKLFDETKEKIKEINEIDYIVITHIDADHIQGIIELLENEELKEKFNNTRMVYNHISKPYINYKHAEKFEKLILERRVIHTCNNHYFEESNLFVKLLSFNKRKEFMPPDDECVYVTFIHPSQKKELEEVYRDYLKKVSSGSYQPNNKLVNKYSIALMIEFKNKRVLFTGDSSIQTLINKLNEFKGIEGKKIDLIKVPHHGAKNENIGLVDFAVKHRCNKFIITGEKRWNKKHPDEELLNQINKMGRNIRIYTSISSGDFSEFALPYSKNIEFKNNGKIDLI